MNNAHVVSNPEHPSSPESEPMLIVQVKGDVDVEGVAYIRALFAAGGVDALRAEGLKVLTLRDGNMPKTDSSRDVGSDPQTRVQPRLESYEEMARWDEEHPEDRPLVMQLSDALDARRFATPRLPTLLRHPHRSVRNWWTP